MAEPTQRLREEKTKYGLENDSYEENIPKWQFWKKRRLLVAFLAFLGFFNVYSLRVNLSIGIVAMTEEKLVTLENGTQIYQAEFDWDSKTKGLLLSSFFYGYITTQIIGGWLGARFGGNYVFGIGILATSLLTLITPPLTHKSVYYLLALRIIEGVFEGVTFPSIHAVWARWAPPLERSRLATLAFSGSYVGTVVAMPVCGILANAFGWESIFYVFGVVGLIWCAVWLMVVKECPSKDPYISQAELKYIEDALGSSPHQKKIVHPWKSILTSPPVWAIVVSHFSENWGFYTLLTQLPTFMSDTLGFDLAKAGGMSALPYVAMAVFIPFSGYLADRFQEKGILTTTQVRKYFNCGAFVAQTVFMIGAAYWLSAIGSTICLTFAVGLGAFAWSGFSVNHLDIAPQHASVLMGLGNTFATLPGILSPLITGYIVQHKSATEWRYVFFIASGIYCVGCIIYWIFASGERQPWALDSPVKNASIVEDNTMKDMKLQNKGIDNATFESDRI